MTIKVISHPSGRPVRSFTYCVESRQKPPTIGFITPRLQEHRQTKVIGFVHKFSSYDDGDEE